jgi:AcrR family transcriptional regulator
MQKQPRITEQTRANLREAFLELYAKRPIEKLSVREITDRAGYNRATFYLYYHDIYELLKEAEDDLLKSIEQLVNERLLKGERLEFSQHMGLILQMTQDSRKSTRAFLGPHGDPTFTRRFKEIIAPLVDRFVMPAGRLGPRESAVVREFYLSGLVAVISAWIVDEDPMPIDQFILLILRTVL